MLSGTDQTPCSEMYDFCMVMGSSCMVVIEYMSCGSIVHMNGLPSEERAVDNSGEFVQNDVITDPRGLNC